MPKRKRQEVDRFLNGPHCQRNIPVKKRKPGTRRRTPAATGAATAPRTTTAPRANAVPRAAATADASVSKESSELRRAREAIMSCRFDPEPPGLNAIAGLDDVKATLRAQLILPITQPQLYENYQ